MNKSLLLCKFDNLAKANGWDGTVLTKEAGLFWKWATLKGYIVCPFPEYLVKFVKGDWCPFS